MTSSNMVPRSFSLKRMMKQGSLEKSIMMMLLLKSKIFFCFLCFHFLSDSTLVAQGISWNAHDLYPPFLLQVA